MSIKFQDGPADGIQAADWRRGMSGGQNEDGGKGSGMREEESEKGFV